VAIRSLASFGLISGDYFDPSRGIDYTVADFESRDFFDFDRIDQPWEITSEGAIGADSQYGLVGDAVSAGAGGLIVSKPPGGVASDGPPAYPQIGDTVAFDWRITAGDAFYFFVGGQDTSFSNRYEISVDLNPGSQSVVADFDDSSTGLLGESNSVDLAQDTAYTTVLTWKSDRSFAVETRDYGSGSILTSFETASDTATDVTTGRFGAYVQPDPATEVHIDDIRLTRPIERTTVDDFEGGVSPRWHVNDLADATERAYSGGGSGRLANAQQDRHHSAWTFDTARRPQSVRVYMQETEGSFGEGLRLRNSNGAIEGGIAIDNPEWDVDDATGIGEVYDPQSDPAATGDGYDRWVELTLLFDWHAGAFDARFRSFVDGSAEVEYTASDRSLRQEVDVASLELWDYDNGTWADGRSIDAWTDDLSRETGQRTERTVPTNLSVTNRESDSLTLGWQGVGPAFDVYRATTSGTSTADYTYITTVQDPLDPSNVTYTDTGLAPDTDYYYRITNATSDAVSPETSATTDTATTFVDDFEDQDFDEYDRVDEPYSITTDASLTADGSYGLYGDTVAAGTGGLCISLAGSGLPAYPSAGDRFRFRFRYDTSDNARFEFAEQDTTFDNSYRIGFRPQAEQVALIVDDAGATTDLATQSITYSTGTIYTIEIDWATDGTISVSITDESGTELVSMSGVDSTFTSGGIGTYVNATGAVAAFDDIKIIETTETTGPTVLTDFESYADTAEFRTAYSGETGGWDLETASPLEGAQSATPNTTYKAIANANHTTPRGYEYLVEIEFPATGRYHKLFTNVQSASAPLADSYEMLFIVDTNTIQFYERIGGSANYLGEVSQTLTTGTRYQAGIETSSDTIQFRLYDESLTQLAASSQLSTTAHAGGCFGAGAGDSAAFIVDNVRQR
jgi:hypothetical protein